MGALRRADGDDMTINTKLALDDMADIFGFGSPWILSVPTR